ncbi:MAG: RagB/SusD family nutrient uptake outer membrane protein [Bacteroidaceae bacterium]|nr:RagB/SusD family nutrient uptake outer membrane protein [Bacteroidaceae bacterium]
MKKLKNIYTSLCLLGLAAVGTTSCEDWLTIYPQDRVVEEDFWEDKNDLEGVRYAAYKQMCSTVQKFAVWGDLRSDSWEMNQNRHGDQGSWDTYNEIMQAQPDSSMSIFDWGGVYTTINFCNKVLQHGEEILEKDKQFTQGEWRQMKAEMVGLRALNYFYLIRAFKDVPYSTKVINKDVEVEYFGLTNQLDVLDRIIIDVESVKGQARNRFTSNNDTKGLITNAALYAMLSDMYLWRASLHEGRGLMSDTVLLGKDSVIHTVEGDYKKCIEYADEAIATLYRNNMQGNSNFGSSVLDKLDFGLTNCELIKNTFDNVAAGRMPILYAQREIFGDDVSSGKNSEESIFELQFSSSDDRKNDVVDHLYGYSNGTHFQVCEAALGAIYGGSINDDNGRYDSRTWYSVSKSIVGNRDLGHYYCFKHSRPSVAISTSGGDKEIIVDTEAKDSYRNWIIYRLTDVMLMKAEAYAAMGGKENNKLAQQIVNAIHRRSFCNLKEDVKIEEDVTTSSANNPKKGDAVMPGSDYVKLVMNERQIELLAEGKRWFDLVRYAERNAGGMDGTADEREWTEDKPIGNGYAGVKKMVEGFMKNKYTNYTVQRNRLKNRYGLYCPIYYMEVKAARGAIEQNPVWNKSKYDTSDFE